MEAKKKKKGQKKNKNHCQPTEPVQGASRYVWGRELAEGKGTLPAEAQPALLE